MIEQAAVDVLDGIRCYRAAEIEVHEDHDGHTIVGRAVPYGEWAEIMDLRTGGSFLECFRFGAFAKSVRERASRVKVHVQHQASRVVGSAIRLEERPDHLYAELHIGFFPAAEEALQMVKDRALDMLSIHFLPVKPPYYVPQDGRRVERTEARLHEISLVEWGAYRTSEITGIRAQVLSPVERPPFDPMNPELAPNLAKARELLAPHGLTI